MERENSLAEIELKTCQFPDLELTNNSAAAREVKSVPGRLKVGTNRNVMGSVMASRQTRRREPSDGRLRPHRLARTPGTHRFRPCRRPPPRATLRRDEDVAVGSRSGSTSFREGARDAQINEFDDWDDGRYHELRDFAVAATNEGHAAAGSSLMACLIQAATCRGDEPPARTETEHPQASTTASITSTARPPTKADVAALRAATTEQLKAFPSATIRDAARSTATSNPDGASASAAGSVAAVPEGSSASIPEASMKPPLHELFEERLRLLDDYDKTARPSNERLILIPAPNSSPPRPEPSCENLRRC